MNEQRGHMRRLIGSVLVSLTAAAVAATLLAPAASASPIGDAEAAIMAAWDKAGGDTSPLGARKGDVYPVGDGFALDFDGGKMFFTPATGAKFAYGPILDKYESLGGPAGSDLGFPSINEVPGLAGPDSRVITFSASDKPVIYWTPDHGAYVVRGAINAAWDKLGSSGGVLGVPVGDEAYSGAVSSQKFSGGQVSWDRQTKQFSTDPPALADQLKGLQVAIDPTAEINTAWRAAGGPNGPLGAKQGGQYPIGGDGLAQNFVGGKVFFSPATGANAIENDILAKEKLCPVVAILPYDNFKQAVANAKANLLVEGAGHSAALHSHDMANINHAGLELPVSRLVINQASSLTAGGSLTNGFAPTTTLGCGSWGGNSISENLDYKHLMNVSRIGKVIENKKVPTDEEIWA